MQFDDFLQLTRKEYYEYIVDEMKILDANNTLKKNEKWTAR